MKRLLLFLFTAAWLPAAAQVSVSSLKVNHMSEPSGVVDAQPVLSWIVESPDRNVMQQAYEVRVFRDGRSVWRTGRVESQNSVTVSLWPRVRVTSGRCAYGTTAGAYRSGASAARGLRA